MVLVTKPKRQPSVRHQKHHGQHQKQTKHFMNTYWPYLPIFIIVGLGLFINTRISHHSQAVLGYSTDISSSSLITNINNDRHNNNDGALSINTQLSNAAQARANDMVKNNYWAHISPTGEQPSEFVEQAGYNYTIMGENLAYGFSNVSSIVSAWMNSPDHRANLLNSKYTNVGFGIDDAKNFLGNGSTIVVVAIFAEPSTAPFSQGHANINLASQKVSAIQVLTRGYASWSLLAATIIATFASLIFIIKHGLLWRRALAKGEEFVIKHPWLDVIVVFIGMTAFLLTRTAGFIG